MNTTIYYSPVFSNHDGSKRIFRIPVDSFSTYAKRDECLLKMIQLGGINAKPTPEFMKLRSKMMAAKRKIEKNGWYSQSVNQSEMVKVV